jgi:large subunit ribosomal protein L30e
MEHELQDVSKEIKQLLKTNKLIFGKEVTLKLLREGKVNKVILCSNSPKTLNDDIAHYAGLSGVQIVHAVQPNDELGVICKKPFSISVLSVKKE